MTSDKCITCGGRMASFQAAGLGGYYSPEGGECGKCRAAAAEQSSAIESRRRQSRYPDASWRSILGRPLFLLALAVFSLPALAQLPGAGIPNAPAGLDYTKRPASERIGHWAESEWTITRPAITAACKANIWGTAATHDCQPTLAEVSWIILTKHKGDGFYRRWSHELKPGGLPGNPIVASPDLPMEKLLAIRADVEVSPRNTWQLGDFTYHNFWGWDTWIRNELPASHPVNMRPPPTPCTRPGTNWLDPPLPPGVLEQCVVDVPYEGFRGACCWQPEQSRVFRRPLPPRCTQECKAVRPVTCPDGVCSSEERAEGSCPLDCPVGPQPLCGDGTCDPSEGCDCPDCSAREDCRVEPPVENGCAEALDAHAESWEAVEKECRP